MHSLKATDFESLTTIQLAIIADTLDEFNFDKVKAYMDDISWQWKTYDDEGNETYKVPNQTTLRAALRKMLIRSYASMNMCVKNDPNTNSPLFSSCGGFTVYVWPDDTCQVYFSVTDHWIDEEWIEMLEK